jgi:nucleoside phosphorylase
MNPSDYNIGWIALLSLEVTDIEYRYIAGKIGDHNGVIGIQSKMGTSAAADLAARMRRACPNMNCFLVVGIGGGVPSYGPAGYANTIVLGDVVVSCYRGRPQGSSTLSRSTHIYSFPPS